MNTELNEVAVLHVAELAAVAPDGLHRLPPIAIQRVKLGAISTPFNAGTRVIRVFSDIPCAVAVGGGEPIPIAANRPESFSVNAGDTVEVVGRDMKNDDGLDAFGIFKIIGDPKASEQRLAQIKSATDGLRKLQAEVSASQSALAEQQAAGEKALADAKAKAHAELTAARQDFATERLKQENALRARESRLAELEARAAANADEVGRLKLDLRRRLDLLHQAGAA